MRKRRRFRTGLHIILLGRQPWEERAALGGKDELDSRIQGAGNGGLPRESLDPQEAFESDSETLEFGHQFINVVDSGRRSLEAQVQ